MIFFLVECLARLQTPPFFISAVGNDHIGQILHLNLKELGVVSSLWALMQSPLPLLAITLSPPCSFLSSPLLSLSSPLLSLSSHSSQRFLPLQEVTGVLQSPDLPTASYCAILDCTGEMMYAIGDMDIHELITVNWVS